MDIRNVAVGMVMEVIATTMAPQAQEDERALPTLVPDNTSVVVDCPHVSDQEKGLTLDVSNPLRVMIIDASGLIVLVAECGRPSSRGVGAWSGTAIAE
jgi:hypothetical protein